MIWSFVAFMYVSPPNLACYLKEPNELINNVCSSPSKLTWEWTTGVACHHLHTFLCIPSSISFSFSLIYPTVQTTSPVSLHHCSDNTSTDMWPQSLFHISFHLSCILRRMTSFVNTKPKVSFTPNFSELNSSEDSDVSRKSTHHFSKFSVSLKIYFII